MEMALVIGMSSMTSIKVHAVASDPVVIRQRVFGT